MHLHPLDLARLSVNDGASVRLVNSRGMVVIATVADDSVLRGTAWVPFNHAGGNAGELIGCLEPVNDVRIETL